ncbi:hypothetical protein J41TS2_17280 [Bacillus sonorensis]|nr:hypothetical protein J41TS2_17280 [Bacillus sonorensis]
MTLIISLMVGTLFVPMYYFGKYMGMRKMANIVIKELNKDK